MVGGREMWVVINGGSGRGKEYVGEGIEELRKGWEKGLMGIEWGCMGKDVGGCELFGDVKGWFRGGLNDKGGGFEEGNGGRLFLDEMGKVR